MSQRRPLRASEGLGNVRYEIRGKLARRALDMERLGYDIVSLNIGNPYAFGFSTPETMRLAMIENLRMSEGYVHQKGIFPAREAVVMQQQERGVKGVTAEEVFIGNGVSELIDLALRALLNSGDEVLVPSPDYPLWTAAVNLNTGRAVHYPCRIERRFIPDPLEIESLITRRTRAIVVINPNNPTGAVYPRAVLEEIARIAEKHRLVVLCDEIYDHIVYDDAEFVPMATLVQGTLCCTMSGLSKVYRACGYRVGWAVFSGDTESAAEYLNGLELLSSLRLCSNVPGTVGGSDGARRPSEHSRADRARRPPVRIASGHRRWSCAEQIFAARATHGCALCLRRGEAARCCRHSTTRHSHSNCWRTSTFWWRRA